MSNFTENDVIVQNCCNVTSLPVRVHVYDRTSEVSKLTNGPINQPLIKVVGSTVQPKPSKGEKEELCAPFSLFPKHHSVTLVSF